MDHLPTNVPFSDSSVSLQCLLLRPDDQGCARVADGLIGAGSLYVSVRRPKQLARRDCCAWFDHDVGGSGGDEGMGTLARSVR
jgi:hypothetical protein